MSHDHRIVPYRSTHLLGVPGSWSVIGADMHRIYEQSPSFSGFCGDVFVAAAGIVVPYPGLGEAWTVPGPGVAGHTTFFYRTLRRGILEVADILKLRRLQSTALYGQPVHHIFLQRLGFRPEATLERYGPAGEDATMYVMFPGGR